MSKLNTPIRLAFMKGIGFMKWARLDPADVAGKLHQPALGPVLLTPDVHDVHIFWKDPDGEIRYEMAGYPDDFLAAMMMSVTDFLAGEVGDDSLECFGHDDIYATLSRWETGAISEDTVPVVTLAALEAAGNAAWARL